MRWVALLAGMIFSAGAQAQPLSLNCRQNITLIGYTLQGRPIQTQHGTATVHYVLDYAEPSLTVRSRTGAQTFTSGTQGQHIIADHNGMTMAGTSQMPNDGPVTSQIIHFTTDGTRGASERKLLLHGKLLQVADTQMTCTRGN
jgi:hypothetical protein